MQATGTVTHKPDAVRLDGFDKLVYAPDQHGEGVRTEDRGILVDAIHAKQKDIPALADLASHFNTTVAHVAQAIAYCEKPDGIKTPVD